VARNETIFEDSLPSENIVEEGFEHTYPLDDADIKLIPPL
jgi:hypothetical protein